ncbi:zinc finger protein 224-like [Phlebotomus papatasi]|uniref:zinc finger protein 224-like n=1 Tax=Phlebotomus papatasi TaxID=29031 RepID=UPI0024846156|nr:zinc finger protein 224-like [Phlebotomus papatasi]
MEQWSVCRLCLQSNEGIMKPLSDVTYNMIPFFNIYFELVGITFMDYPTFPGKICMSCEEQLYQAYRFREQCLETEDRLKEFLNEGSNNFANEFITSPKNKEKKPFITIEGVFQGSSSDHASTEKINIKKEYDSEMEFDFPEYETTSTSIGDSNSYSLDKSKDAEDAKEDSKTKKEVPLQIILCKQCKGAFKGIVVFKKHNCNMPGSSANTKPKRVRKEKPKKVYECTECQKIFQQSHAYMIHMDKHNNFLRYACDQCDKKFSTWLQRRNHVYRIHLKKAYCECSYCGKGYYKKHDLSVHINSAHLKTKTSQCDTCGKTFYNVKQFQKHLKNHGPQEKVQCKVCSKWLKNEKTLVQHMRIHSDEKNYICPVCSLEFTWNASLKSHVRSVHPDHVHLLPPDGTIVNKGYLKKLAENAENA